LQLVAAIEKLVEVAAGEQQSPPMFRPLPLHVAQAGGRALLLPSQAVFQLLELLLRLL
jgi:hypothetical protein